jgi:hypothetical protein
MKLLPAIIAIIWTVALATSAVALPKDKGAGYDCPTDKDYCICTDSDDCELCISRREICKIKDAKGQLVPYIPKSQQSQPNKAQ